MTYLLNDGGESAWRHESSIDVRLRDQTFGPKYKCRVSKTRFLEISVD